MIEQLVVIWENDIDELVRMRHHSPNTKHSNVYRFTDSTGGTIPKNYRQKPVTNSTYRQYRQRLTGATVDIIICRRTIIQQKKSSRLSKPEVLGMLRAPGNAYANQWFMAGGSLPAYESIEDFLKRKTKEECGVTIERVEALLGVYRISAEDTADSSITVCYVTTVPEKTRVRLDENHSAYEWFTEESLKKQSSYDIHPYPMRVFSLALQTTLY